MKYKQNKHDVTLGRVVGNAIGGRSVPEKRVGNERRVVEHDRRFHRCQLRGAFSSKKKTFEHARMMMTRQQKLQNRTPVFTHTDNQLKQTPFERARADKCMKMTHNKSLRSQIAPVHAQHVRRFQQSRAASTCCRSRRASL